MADKLKSLKEIEPEELNVLSNPKYVKYICASTGKHTTNTFIKLGEEANEADVISSIFSIIYATYRGLYDDPDTRDLALWFRKETVNQITKDAFWDKKDPEGFFSVEELEELNKRILS